MLWLKGWLETRFRLLFALGFVGFVLGSAYSFKMKTPVAVKVFVGTAAILVAMLSGMLAGAGIATQPAVQATKGLHGSMLFTLSLPVSRFRLLAVRAGLGWLEMVGGIVLFCCGMWGLFPIVRETTTAVEMLEYAGVLAVCGSGLHFIGVLLATFLDDLWRMYGTMIAYGGIWWLSSHVTLPVSADIFRAMGTASPLVAHAIPWTAMASSLGLSAALFLAALKIVQTREY